MLPEDPAAIKERDNLRPLAGEGKMTDGTGRT